MVPDQIPHFSFDFFICILDLFQSLILVSFWTKLEFLFLK